MVNHITAMLHSACARAEEGEFDMAVAELETLLALEPGNAAALQLLGLVQARQGRMRAAARILRQACLAAPDRGMLHVHMARVEWALGLPAQAAAAYQQAISLGSATPDILTDCAVALGRLERHAEALDHCDKAMAQNPDHARAWQTKASLLHAMNRLEEALPCHERALALAPDAVTLSAKALTLHALDRFVEALACHDAALALSPCDPSILTHRGVTLGKMARHEEAAACHARATELDPAHATAWSNLGASLCKLERLDASIAAHDKAVSLSPSSAAMWLQRGAALICATRLAEALASCNAAIRLDPSSAEAWRHRAIVLRSEGRYAEALESAEEACSLDIGCIGASCERADLLVLLDRCEEATAWLMHALSRMPANPKLRFALGMEQLRSGDFARGWANYQAYRTLRPAFAPVDESIPVWSGSECLQGKRLLVYAEQGYGDVIQFCRFVPQLAARGCAVCLVVYAPLMQLLSCLDGCEVLAYGEPVPPGDFQLPLMALPMLLVQNVRDIPARTPYLFPPDARRARLPSHTGLRIGIACSVNPSGHASKQRSAPLAGFERLQRHGTLFLLQNSLQPDDAAWLEGHPSIQHPTAGFVDFASTADVTDAMDLVISVDTSIAHLAGALGKPLWLLLPYFSEWRWMHRNTTTSPWYPTARLFRQPAQGNWEEVFSLLDQELVHFSQRLRHLRKGVA